MIDLDKKILVDDDIENLISNNTLNRKYELCNVLQILQEKEDFNIIGLCGQWGSGKTIFCKQLNFLINKDTKQQELLNKSYTKLMRSIYVNAWEFDQSIDPILSLISAITKQVVGLSPSKQITGIVKTIANSIVKTASAGILNLDDIQFEDFLEAVKDSDILKERIQNYLNEIIDEKINRLLIIVDELDRCNAKYIINFLERLNCYFNDYRVTFLISMNEKEIIHSLNSVYGPNYNSGEYLDKIIDSRISLREVTFGEYVIGSNLEDYEHNWIWPIIEHLSNYFNLSLRNINRLSNYILRHYEKHFSMHDKTRSIVDLLVIPYLFCLKLKEPLNFYNFKSDEGKELFIEVFSSFKRMPDLLNSIFKSDLSGKEKEILGQIHDALSKAKWSNDFLEYYYKKLKTF